MSCCSATGRALALLAVLLAAPALAEEQLTTDGLLKRDPVYWPGSRELVYTVEADTGRMRLMKLNVASGQSTQFHEQKDLSDRELTVSSDGKVYAYNDVRGLSSKIVVEDARQGKKYTVSKESWSNWPSLSPDGNRVLFTSLAGPILVCSLKNGEPGEPRRLSEEGDNQGDLWPSFSPDGKRIVLSSRRDQDFEIYVMDADGSHPQRLTTSPGVDSHPRFSPDAKQIVFTSNRDGNYEIYVMDADGSRVRRVTNNAERDDHPNWHPDGKRIVYVSERNGRYDLYLAILAISN